MKSKKVIFKFIPKEVDNDELKDEKVIHLKYSRKNKVKKLSREEYHKTKLEFTVSEFKGVTEYDPFGMIFFPSPGPSKKIINGISSDSMLEFINSNIIFDSYEPKDKDKLYISTEYKHPDTGYHRPHTGGYFSFKFEKKWRIVEAFEDLDNEYSLVFDGEIIQY